MSEEPKGDGPSLEELLDNTPEAVAMRRRLVVGGVLALVTAARVMVKLGRSSRTP